MKEAFERLGITKKLEDIKPDIETCKDIYGMQSRPQCLSLHELNALKKVIEFIECIDEP